MTKKKKKPAKSQAGMKKKQPAKKAKSASGWPAAGVITIGEGNSITAIPDSIRLQRDSNLTFVVVNQDIADHDVWLDPSKVTNKNTGQPEDPWAGKAARTRVSAGGTKTLKFRMKKKYGTPDVTFKYTVDSFAKNGPMRSLDPDLDVVDPRNSASGQ